MNVPKYTEPCILYTENYMLNNLALSTGNQVHGVNTLIRVQLFVTPWTVCTLPGPWKCMGFSSQEHWSELPSPSPGDLPDPGIEPTSSALAGRFFTTENSTDSFSTQGKPMEPEYNGCTEIKVSRFRKASLLQ